MSENNDSRRIIMPSDPAERKYITKIMEAERKAVRAAENRKDYRSLLTEAQASTDDFLRDTSLDRFYDRPLNIQTYKSGGWL